MSSRAALLSEACWEGERRRSRSEDTAGYFWNGRNTLDFGEFGGRRSRGKGTQVEVAENDARNVANITTAVFDAV